MGYGAEAAGEERSRRTEATHPVSVCGFIHQVLVKGPQGSGAQKRSESKGHRPSPPRGYTPVAEADTQHVTATRQVPSDTVCFPAGREDAGCP